MIDNLKKATRLLSDNKYTCVLCNDSKTYTSTSRGVRPLVLWYESKTDFSGFSAADKVIGKGAAFLYILLGIKYVYAGVISQSALDLLHSHDLYVEHSSLVKNIINRSGDGICPFEQMLLDINDEIEAYTAIRRKMKEMNIL